MMHREIHAGFIPLTDCAPLVIASELGFDRQYGLSIVLHREVSWANIRDKVGIGALDCAHMLAPMPIAAQLGLGRATEPIIAPMALSLNGNAITVSMSLYEDMRKRNERATLAGGMSAAEALAAVVRARQSAGREPLTLGMVYPFSSPQLRSALLARCCRHRSRQRRQSRRRPPPPIAENLKAGRVDGFASASPGTASP